MTSTHDLFDDFRAKLSAELRAAMVKRDKEEVSTLRSIMSALDNAGALSKEDISQLSDTSKTEVARKSLCREDILAILQSEVLIRKNAYAEYERIGNKSQADINERSILTIQRLAETIAT